MVRWFRYLGIKILSPDDRYGRLILETRNGLGQGFRCNIKDMLEIIGGKKIKPFDKVDVVAETDFELGRHFIVGTAFDLIPISDEEAVDYKNIHFAGEEHNREALMVPQ